jgi:hypothetical protein
MGAASTAPPPAVGGRGGRPAVLGSAALACCCMAGPSSPPLPVPAESCWRCAWVTERSARSMAGVRPVRPSSGSKPLQTARGGGMSTAGTCVSTVQPA